MLYNPGNDFNFTVDNWGSTYTDAGLGTNLPGNASAHAKGANTALLSGLAEDCYGLSIMFCGGNSSATIRRQMTDILIDPAAGAGNAGSSWSVLIANLYSNSPAAAGGPCGYWYYFPIYLKKGTAIGGAHQDLANATAPLRCCIRAYGKPSRPELLKVGTQVQTLGATVATTTGVAITPGTSVAGSVTASLGTLTRDCFWHQLGIGSADTTIVSNSYWFDMWQEASTTTNIATGIPYYTEVAERCGKGAWGLKPPEKFVPAGANIAVSAAGAAAPDTSMTVVSYHVS